MTIRTDLKLFREVNNPYRQFNLLRNPFPSYGDTRNNVCTDQEALKRTVVDRLQHFDSTERRVRIDGDYGAGKTNVLRYFQRLTEQANDEGLIPNHIQPIYVLASGEDYMELHAQIVEQLLEYSLEKVLVRLSEGIEEVDVVIDQYPSVAEVFRALQHLTAHTSSPGQQFLFKPHEERILDSFQRWFKGQRLTVQARKYIHDVQDIGSPSLAIKYLHGYLQVLRHFKVCHAILLLIDEFEQIFVSVPRSKQSRYAQDIRHLMDTLDSVALIIVATIPDPKDLSQYPALERRMDEGQLLEPIRDARLAEAYVIDYLRSGRAEFEQEQRLTNEDFKLTKREMEALTPLTRDIIREVFDQFQLANPNRRVLPGYYLPSMRQKMKELVENA